MNSIDHERLKINDAVDLKIDIDTVGDQQYPLMIVDNLYRDPEYVREVALELEFGPLSTSHPGNISRLQTDITELHTLIWKHVARHFGYTAEDTIRKSNFPGLIFTRIHRTREDLTMSQCRPHSDPLRVAGVVYLNRPEQCRGGTSFFRHRATGVEEAVLPKKNTAKLDATFMQHAEQLGVLESYRTYSKNMFSIPYVQFIRMVLTTMPREKNYLIRSNEDWELTRTVEMKFNRMICYPGFLIHSGNIRDEWFGEGIDEHRLTQNIFIN